MAQRKEREKEQEERWRKARKKEEGENRWREERKKGQRGQEVGERERGVSMLTTKATATALAPLGPI